ncbi:MAG TPA: amidohydrolase family protein [Acidimicrobiales bacterium]|nr:amidohydrolase family protein [Acidimicrobiales bacterium]
MTEAVLLDNFSLVNGTGRPPVSGAWVMVEEGVIVSVGTGSPPATTAKVLEGRGRWLLPGLWDSHMHIGFSAGGLVSPEELSDEQLLLNWRAYLRSGVTSAVSVGDDPRTILAARAAEREGRLLGPRIFAAGSVFTAPGGHPVGTILHGEAARLRGLAAEVADPVEGRRRLRRHIEEDEVDLVKVIYSSIPGDGPRLGRDVLDALVDEAHRLGRRIVAHVATSAEAAECVAAGVDGVEHMVLDDGDVLEAVLAAARERGVCWTPTLCLFDRMAHDDDPAPYIEDYHPEGFVSRTVLASVREWAARARRPAPGSPVPRWERTVELAGRAHAAGVRLALGTDAGMPAVFHGLAVHQELELLVRAGLTPTEALTAATATAAAKVGADAQLGTIEVGKQADLLILRESPLEDIRNTRSIDLVIKRGSLFHPAELTVE